MNNRLKKAALLLIRKLTCRNRFLALYYWADLELFRLRKVQAMPNFYYLWLYQTCMWLAERRKFRKLADVAMHRIPFHVRFELTP